jgi:hypothetical protein
MKEYHPTPETCIFIGAFFVVYIALLLRRVVRNRVDLYDFFMLATLGIIPLCFVLFPHFVSRLSRLAGVEFPFLLLFGALSLVTFAMIYRLIRRSNKLRNDVVRLVQEAGVLRHEVEELRRSFQGDGS